MNKKSTTELEKVLKSTHPENIESYYAEEDENLYDEDRSFRGFIKGSIKGKKTLHEVFYAADINEGYGYKLLSGEKHTNKRDVILRLCIASEMDLKETQTALKLYGFSPLYAKIKRDALLMSAINEKMSIERINDLLKMKGFAVLEECGTL